MNLILKPFTISFQRLYRWCHDLSAYFSKSGARKRRFLTFAKNPGNNSVMPPAPNVIRWTSVFKAIEYHTENLYVKKTFLELEFSDSSSDMLASLKEFLISNLKFINFEASFVVKRAKHLLAALVHFESNFGLAFRTISYMETHILRIL